MAKKKIQSKKESKKIEEVNSTETTLIDKLSVALCVLVFIFGFYLLTLYITNKNTDKTNTEDTSDQVNVSNEYILLGKSLSMNNKSYLVIFYDKNSEDSIYSEIVNNYKEKNELSIYKVDMSSAFNKKYMTSEESNKNPSSASDFKINGPTLIKVENKKVINYIEGEEAIKNYLN